MEPLDPAQYTIAWIAPLAIEAQAALNVLDNKHPGRFSLGRGDDHVFRGGDINGRNVVIATLPAGQEYGTGSAAALASQLKKFFPNLWFGLLVGVAAGLPNLAKQRDIRLGDVLVGLPIGENAGIVAYDLGKETSDGFQLLQCGRALAHTEPVVRSAIGSFMIDGEESEAYFLSIYESLKLKKHSDGDFSDPGEEKDVFYDTVGPGGSEIRVDRKKREKRTHVWYGTIGSGDKLVKNASIRNRLRDTYDIIGLEMEAAGTMNRIPVGVIRGVCDYGDEHKNKDWQPYAAAMAATYAKALFRDFGAGEAVGKQAATVTRAPKLPILYDLPPKAERFFGREKELSGMREILVARGNERKGLVLCGIPGSGKTQLARNFVDREAKSFSAILWIDATSEMSAMQALDSCARSICQEFTKSKPSDDTTARHVVIEWLRETPNRDWLLVLDGMDDMIPHRKLLGLLSQLPHGAICITSTHYGVARAMRVKQILVEQLDPAAAKDMVLWHALGAEQQPGNDDQEAARQVSKILHCFPIAIELSGTLIREGIVSLLSFPAIFETKYARLAKFNLSDELRIWSKDDSLFGLFETMYESLVQRNAEAGLLLSLCSVYGASRIPISVLAGLKLHMSDESPWKQLKDMLQDDTEFNTAIYELSRMFLAKKRHASDGSVSSLYFHSSICQWRFNVLDNRPEWIIQASYGLADYVQTEEARYRGPNGESSGSAIRYVHLANRCLSAIEKYVPAGDLEAPKGKFATQYFTIASSFACMYHSLSEVQVARRLFAAAISYTRTQDNKSLSHQQLVTLFHAYGTACARTGGWDNAEDALKTALTMAESAYGHMSDEAVQIGFQLKSVRRSLEDDVEQRRRAVAGMTGPKRRDLPVSAGLPSHTLGRDHSAHKLGSAQFGSSPYPTTTTGSDDVDLVISISMGLTYTAVAYINKAANSNEIQIFRHWRSGSLDDKVPSLLQYPSDDPSDTAKPVAWGFGCNPYTMDGTSRIVEVFKDDLLRQNPFQYLVASRYVFDYLDLLYRNLREHLTATVLNGREWDETFINSGFSIPAHWDQPADESFLCSSNVAGFDLLRHWKMAFSTIGQPRMTNLAISSRGLEVQNGENVLTVAGHEDSSNLTLMVISDTVQRGSNLILASRIEGNLGLRSLISELFASRVAQLGGQKPLFFSVNETIWRLARAFDSQNMQRALRAVELDDDEVFETQVDGILAPVDVLSWQQSQKAMDVSWGEIRRLLDKQFQQLKDSLNDMLRIHCESTTTEAFRVDRIMLVGGIGTSLYVQKKFKDYLSSCTDGYLATARLFLADDLQLAVCRGMLLSAQHVLSEDQS